MDGLLKGLCKDEVCYEAWTFEDKAHFRLIMALKVFVKVEDIYISFEQIDALLAAKYADTKAPQSVAFVQKYKLKKEAFDAKIIWMAMMWDSERGFGDEIWRDLIDTPAVWSAHARHVVKMYRREVLGSKKASVAGQICFAALDVAWREIERWFERMDEAV